MQYRFTSDDGSLIIAARGDGTELLIEPGHDGWAVAIASNPALYIAPPLPDPLIEEREGMVCSRFQAMAALLDADLLSIVSTALSGAGPLAQLAWAEATEFHRNSPTIAAIASGLGLTDLQTDDLFRAAMAITA